MAKNRHYYSKREGRENSEETLDQRKTEEQLGHLQIRHLCLPSKPSSDLQLLCFVDCITLLCVGSTLGLQLSLAGIPQP